MRKGQLNPVVRETIEDFKARQEERKNFENQWCNIDFP